MNFSWKRILIKTFIGLVTAGIGLTAYAFWLGRDGFCIKYYSDGRQETLYGAECEKGE
ncbi:hypothetical protein VB713_11835 [Anabaena cylindrica UHCC 0172]|uniref:hypothetical protein n=1 Tax=Anabaena cylindrica TaxID=1165 RepID=UPI002B21A76C|nr:hypothetical protein [Anabaena cylindrica]MEA5551661.1 hypothetical protein [Anabaena cylindrica UHCC 0172]